MNYFLNLAGWCNALIMRDIIHAPANKNMNYIVLILNFSSILVHLLHQSARLKLLS